MPDDRPYHALSVIPDIEQLILQGIASGKSLKAIADEYKVSDVAILRRIEDNPDYKPLRRIGLRLRMDQREQELESAEDNVSVTRADRLLGHARWLAERLDSETYGQKSHLTVEHVDYAEEIRKAREARTRVIEGEATTVDAVPLPQDSNGPPTE
jgi:tRNA-dihydrouridine synthase